MSCPTPTERPLLWHLAHITAGSDSDFTACAALWSAAEQAAPVRVALIDTGVDSGHPHLAGAMAAPQMDFGPHLCGVTYAPPGAAPPPGQPVDDSARADLAGFLARPEYGDLAALLAPLTRAPEAPAEVIATDDPSEYFGTHGTGCAGLICARPAPDPTDAHGQSLPPYCGVNPAAQLLSYATPYSHEILPVIAALARAFLSGAEVIVMPRGVPNPDQRAARLAGSPYRTRIDTPPGDHPPPLRAGDHADFAKLTRHWALLIALMRFIAARRYLVLAAGNDGFADRLSEPAQSLRDDPHVVITGALNDRGRVSSYSNQAGGMLYMLSDDGFALDDRHFAVDPRSYRGTDYDYSAMTGAENSYSPWGILSLDPRGSYGAAPGAHDDPPWGDEPLEAGSLYALFSGTSAASALMAGLVSLLLQSGRLPAGQVLTRADLGGALRGFYPRVFGPET